MGRKIRLSEHEKGQIDALFSQKLSHRQIAKRIGRSPNVVDHYLKNSDAYGKNYKGRTKVALTPKENRKIIRLASNSALSIMKIKDQSNVTASKSTVRRTILKAKHLKYMKLKKKPPLNMVRKQLRLDFAKAHMAWSAVDNNDPGEWKKVVFTDEKKFNLDGPDGYNYYFHDLRKEERFLSRHHSREGGVMVWGAISYYGIIDLKVVDTRMTGLSYKALLELCFPKLSETFGPLSWILQHDNAPIHTAKVVKDMLSSKNVPTLPWPPYSPDLNIIENVWGWLTRKVYENGKQFETKEDLIEGIKMAWSQISLNYLESLYKSIPGRIYDVIYKQGSHTKY